jgi:hypothetical protein
MKCKCKYRVRIEPRFIQYELGSILCGIDYLRENRDTTKEAKRRDDGIVEGGKAVQGPEATD